MSKRPAFFVSPFLGLVLLGFSLLPVSETSAQRRHGSSPLDNLGDEEVSQADGLEILNTFRSLGIAGEYRLNFQLRVMPKGEKTRTFSGVLLGAQSSSGPISRIDLALEGSEVDERGALIPAKVKRLLLQNGLFANALEVDSWAEPSGEARLLGSGEYFEAIAGSDFTVFDLLMPFTFWQEFRYEGRTKQRGRPTHVFTLYPPNDDEQIRSFISSVRVFIDEEFNVLMGVEIFNADQVLAKTISVVSFKLVDGQGVLSQVDVRNEETRDKTRFKVLDAALGIDAPDRIFQPEGLGENVYGTELARLPSLAPAEDQGELGQ